MIILDKKPSRLSVAGHNRAPDFCCAHLTVRSNVDGFCVRGHAHVASRFARQTRKRQLDDVQPITRRAYDSTVYGDKLDFVSVCGTSALICGYVKAPVRLYKIAM